jgi:hypothetical protein
MCGREEERTVTQRSIEVVMGRLMTDEEFRGQFRRDPHEALTGLVECGAADLTRAEIAALVAMDSDFWERAAAEIDPRLQKANLKS